MPELPEVETTLRGIQPHILQKKINQVIVRQHQLRWPIPKNIQKLLADKKIINLTRRGKYILLHVNGGAIIIHLGMSGRLRILDLNVKPEKHDHVDIEFTHKKILRYTDPRRFGAILWSAENPENHALLKNLGVEPLDKHFSAEYLLEKAKTKNMAIKSFIMDGKIVTGIGNIYATEALFQSHIHPLMPAKKLTSTQSKVLVTSIKHILRQAIKKGGTTLKDFYNSDGKPGYFVQQLQVYGRAGLPCVDCGELLQTLFIAQRSSVFCANCQILK